MKKLKVFLFLLGIIQALHFTCIAQTSFESVVQVMDNDDMVQALTMAQSQPITKIDVVCSELTGTFIIPKTLASKSKRLIIDFNGCTVNGGIRREKPTDQKEALNVMNQYTTDIYNGVFTGAGTGIEFNSCYGAVISNCRFSGKDSAIVVRFGLKTIIDNCFVTNCKKAGITLSYGDWLNASNSNSQSNHSQIQSCRVFNADSVAYAFGLFGASGCSIVNSISEGGAPKVHVLFDGNNSTVVKDFLCQTLHLESKASVSAIKVSVREGDIVLSGIYVQYGQVLVDATSQAGYPNIEIKNITWKPSGTTLKSTGGCRWFILGGAPSIDWTTTTTWVGGALPPVLVQTKITGNGIDTKQFINGKIK